MGKNDSNFAHKHQLDLLYTNAPVGVGGQILNINLCHSKLGLGDKNYRVN